MNKFLKTMLIVYLFSLVLLLFYCLIFTGKTNHSSFNFTKIFIWLGIIGIIIGLIILVFIKTKTMGLIFLISGILIIILGFLLNIFNIMISYDLWLRRKMPNKYTFFIQ